MLTQDDVDHEVFGLAGHGSISFRELRMCLQKRTGTDLAMETVLIRQLAEVSVQKLELGMSCCGAVDKSTGRAFSRDCWQWHDSPHGKLS